RRHDREDRPADGEVLEHLPGEDAPAAAARLRDQEEERLRVTLERERGGARRVRDQLEAVAEAERLRPLAVGGTEVAEEPRRHVEARVGQRLQERPWVASSEEAAGMGDPEALGRMALQAGDVVEVAAVGDRADGPARPERARLLADRLRDA